MTRSRVQGSSRSLGAVMLVLGQISSLACSSTGGSGGDSSGTGTGGAGAGTGAAASGTGATGAGTGASTSTGTGATGSGTGGGPNAGGGDGAGGSAAIATDAPSAAYVRRLTHIEYDNTIFDLLGVDTKPSSNFEPDLAQDGFTNNSAGQSVSPTLVEQYTVAAEAISELATANLTALLGCDPVSTGEQACVKQFITTFGKKAWRRPLSVEEEGRLLALFTKARVDFELDEAVEMVIQVFLESPQFIYLLEPIPAGAAPGAVAPLDAWEMAARLSYFLVGSTPDAALLEAAAAGELGTAAGVADQARRLLTLPRARERVGLFFTEWLRLRNIERMQKDQTLFPNYNLTLAPMMLEQIKLFTQSIILDEGGTATDLLTAPYSFITPELAPFYGVPRPSSPPGKFERVEFDADQRAGLLTHVAVLSTLAHGNQTDPVHRGKFVRNGLLCETIDPPPSNIVISVPEVQPGATTRERFAKHQEDPVCRECHIYMDPIGLGFETYDAVGQWRDMDAGQPVDASGEVVGSDVAGPFNGAVELANKLSKSEQVMECMARTWLRFALGRSDLAADAGAVTAAGGKFKESGYVMKDLLVALTETNTFRSKLVLDANTSSLSQEKP